MEEDKITDQDHIAAENEKAEAKKLFSSGTTYAGIGFVLVLIGELFNPVGGTLTYLGKGMMIIGLPVFFVGCFRMAKGKGYHMAWGLLGFLSIIGIIILYLMPNRIERKHKTA